MPGTHVSFPKPEPRARTKGRGDRVKAKGISAIHDYVFDREANICRCCRIRPAQSMHEIVSRGRGGKVSKVNSVAVCGALGNDESCHGQLQRYEIVVRVESLERGAEDVLHFEPRSRASADWLRIPYGQSLASGATPKIRDEVTL